MAPPEAKSPVPPPPPPPAAAAAAAATAAASKAQLVRPEPRLLHRQAAHASRGPGPSAGRRRLQQSGGQGYVYQDTRQARGGHEGAVGPKL